jgi:hypothetical protein
MMKKMKKMFSLQAALCILCAWVFLQFSCAGQPETMEPEEFPESAESAETGVFEETVPLDREALDIFDHPDPGDLVFISSPFPSLTAAPGIGNITRESRDRGSLLSSSEREALSASFRGAYIDGILRGVPLSGVLGGDLVHGWPENNPSGWVQNWQTTEAKPNSWGIPSIILAVQNIEIAREMAQDRVFIVQGGVLDFYGKSAGMGGANGDTGYGSPRGEEFFYNGSIAQRFDLGIIIVDGNGQGTFVPGVPPSEGIAPPPEVGTFTSPPASYGDRVRDAFLTAWKMALDRNIEAMVPDGSGTYVSFSTDPFGFPDSGAKGIYVQTFNQRTALLVLIDTDALPLHARFIMPPFLDILLFPENYSPRDSKGLSALNVNFSGGDSFIRQLMRGFALYGLPLTDPLPGNPGDRNSSAYREEAQRFTRGWLAGSAKKVFE